MIIITNSLQSPKFTMSWGSHALQGQTSADFELPLYFSSGVLGLSQPFFFKVIYNILTRHQWLYAMKNMILLHTNTFGHSQWIFLTGFSATNV